jgi:hypothetical protein
MRTRTLLATRTRLHVMSVREIAALLLAQPVAMTAPEVVHDDLPLQTVTDMPTAVVQSRAIVVVVQVLKMMVLSTQAPIFSLPVFILASQRLR